MNITFLVGNGFDRNLGLHTAYSDFVKFYKTLTSESEYVNEFRTHIKENEELWSSAEEALGQYTEHLEKGQGLIFSECQADFCEKLAQYLKLQERRINYAEHEEAIKQAFRKFENLTEPFAAVERSKISRVYQNYRQENITFNFINYNYTYTLDNCLKIVEEFPGLLGSHRYSSSSYKHIVGTVCHVHGTVDGQMVFGVNDDSQIAKLEVFEGNDGDLSKALLIKKDANESYRENTDIKAAQILKSSTIIYIYGMALGITDKLWWERICEWLVASENRHLILHQYEMPDASVLPVQRLQFERKVRRDFLKLGNLPDVKWKSVEDRIHVTSDNIFASIKNIAIPISAIPEDSCTNEKELASIG